MCYVITKAVMRDSAEERDKKGSIEFATSVRHPPLDMVTRTL